VTLLSVFSPPITGESSSSLETLAPERAIGALWRRILAFVIDGLVLGLVGFVVGLPFFETFSALGPWGSLVGFCLALPYFSILNSTIGNGQTLGKRLMHIKVVDRNGNPIPFWKSVIRYGVFAVPYFLNEALLPTTRTPWVVSIVVSVAVFGVGGASLYLVVFNRRTRQGIHDLAAGSYVADAYKDGALRIEPSWRFHWLILSALLLSLFVSTGILSDKLAQWRPFPQLLEDVRLVEGMEGVQAAGVQDMNSRNFSSGGKKTTLVINVYWAGKSAGNHPFTESLTERVTEGWAEKQPIADQAAKLIIGHDSTVKEHDSLKVVVIRGYNIGIAHAQISYTYEHTPAEWNARLFGTSPTEQAPSKL
jgi:uncharacterized RDD family membrane protein YckC